VYTLEGRLVYSERFVNPTAMNVQMPENLKEGLYMVQLQTEKQTRCLKLMKQSSADN
jgi:hypothetical protein